MEPQLVELAQLVAIGGGLTGLGTIAVKVGHRIGQMRGTLTGMAEALSTFIDRAEDREEKNEEAHRRIHTTQDTQGRELATVGVRLEGVERELRKLNGGKSDG